ncbi:MAG: hypothetical protein M3004_11400 [Bacteroidota bacterium]|nr:hypothetical protein [Bacteroidota bacterium]
MKKILFTLVIISSFAFAGSAQTTTSSAMSKGEKAKLKSKQEEDLTASFKQAGLTDDQTAQARIVLADALAKSNDLKKNTTLNDADKEVEKQKINDEKNGKLKAIMADKYKTWSQIRKEQKSKMEEGKTQ